MTTKAFEKTLLTVKTDKELKKAAQKTAEELGIPLGTFINMTLRQFVRDKKIDFSINTPNRKTRAAILEKEIEGPFTIKQLSKKWDLE